jgi:hypothetical protein
MVAEAVVQGFYYVTDVVGLEEVDQYARCCNGVSILLADVCDWLRQWAETLSPNIRVGVSGV